MLLKSRYGLITFLPNKSDKFGVKFYMLVGAQTKYVHSILPYLDVHAKELRGKLLLTDDLVLRLLQDLLNIADNYCTRMALAANRYDHCEEYAHLPQRNTNWTEI